MRSSNEGFFLSNGPIYSLLALYMPLMVLTALVFLLRGLLPLSPLPLLASGVLGALVATFYYDFMKDEKANHTAANVRAVIITLIISYIFSTVFRRGRDIYWEERFVPDLSALLAFVGTLYAWFSVIALKRLFRARRRFEAITESYQGEQLHEALYKDPYLLQYIDARLFKVQRNYMVQLILVGILFLINVVYTAYVHPAVYVLLIVILASGMCIAGFFGIIRREHYCAAKGMSLSSTDRAKHLLWIGILTALPIMAALLLSSDKSLLPVSIITGFFAWLFSLFRWFLGLIVRLVGKLLRLLLGKSVHEPVDDPEPLELAPFPSFPDQIEKSSPPFIWTVLQYGFIVLAAAGFVWFMILPLLRRVRAYPGELSFFQKLRCIAAEWFGGVLTGLASFFAFIRSGGTMRKLPRYDADAIQRTAGAVLGAYAQAKKRAIKQNVTLFARLIIWGGEVRQVTWKPVHAPGEYCRILAQAAPAEAPKIIRCGELFEKALYSAELLSNEEQKEFRDMVEEITSIV